MQRSWVHLIASISLLALTALPFAPGCHDVPHEPPDIILIVIDTLRADHVSLYGYHRPTTPNLEALAERGVAFERAYTPSGATGVAHASLFTSKDPLAHRVVRNGLVLPDIELTLAERLGSAGYLTAAFVSSFPISRRFGFDQGFAHFDDDFDRGSSSARHESWEGVDVEAGFDRSPEETTSRALRWLDAGLESDAPLFMWVHYFDPHSPYKPPAEFSGRFEPAKKDSRSRRQAIANYDAEIAYVDAEIERLLGALEERRPGRSRLVIVTSDHGEGLWTHGYVYHGRYTYEEEVRIPLIMVWDGVLPKGLRSAQPANLIDIAPTVLAAARIDPGGDRPDGIDLIPIATGAEAPDPERPIHLFRPYYPEGRSTHRQSGHGFGLRLGDFKYFEANDEGAVELFDLSTDPGERKNIASENPEEVARLSAIIAAWHADQIEQVQGGALAVPEDALTGLRALGYVDGEDAEAPAPPE